MFYVVRFFFCKRDFFGFVLFVMLKKVNDNDNNNDNNNNDNNNNDNNNNDNNNDKKM